MRRGVVARPWADVAGAIAAACLIGATARAGPDVPPATPDARPPGHFTETLLLRVPVGPGASAISNHECTTRESPCAAGIAMLSPADSLYFYDIANDNVKVMALRPTGRLVRVIPGLGPRRTATRMPVAGVAGADGSLQILMGAPGRGARPDLWTLEPGVSEWRRAPAAEFRGASAPTRAGSGAAPRGVPADALLLGRDLAGRSFAQLTVSWSTQALAAFGPDGRLMAQTILPERPIWKMLLGGTDKWVTPDGDVVEVYVSARWLVVSMWTSGS